MLNKFLILTYNERRWTNGETDDNTLEVVLIEGYWTHRKVDSDQPEKNLDVLGKQILSLIDTKFLESDE